MCNKLPPIHSGLKQQIFILLWFLWVRNLFTTWLYPLKRFNMFILEDKAGLSERLNVVEVEKEIRKYSQVPGFSN